MACLKKGDQCSGYEPIYVWVKGYHNYPQGRRRVLRSGKHHKELAAHEGLTVIDLTWHGHSVHQSSEVDTLIAHCDVESHHETEPVEKAAGPFTVFCAPAGYPRLPPYVSDIPDSSRGDIRTIKELCHHYFAYTAQNMMPYKDKWNPWMNFYPRLARQGSCRGQKSLYNAMLAQAAGNLAQLGSQRDKMSALAMKFYTDGVKDLRKGLESKDMDFSTVVASIMTLIMAEVKTAIPNHVLRQLTYSRSTLVFPAHGECISTELGTSS